MISGYYDNNQRQENVYMPTSNTRDIGSKNESKNLTVDELIDWIRSFQYQECQNVVVLNDLQNGVVFCQLAHDIIYCRQKPDFIARIMRQNTQSASLINMTTALNAIKDSSFDIPAKIFSIQPQQLCEENELKLKVLQYLYILQLRRGENIFIPQQIITDQNQDSQSNNQNIGPATNNYMNNNSSSQKFFTPRSAIEDNTPYQNLTNQFQNQQQSLVPKYNAGSLFFNNKQKPSQEISKISSIQHNQFDNSNYNSISSRATDPLYIPLQQSPKGLQANLTTPNTNKFLTSQIQQQQQKNIASSKIQQNLSQSISQDKQNQQQRLSIGNRLNTLNSPVSPITQISNFKNQNMLVDYSSISTPNHMISMFANQTYSTPDLKGQGRVFHHQQGGQQVSRFNTQSEQPQITNPMMPTSISNRESSLSKIPPSILQSQSNTSTIIKKRKNVTLDLRDQQDQIGTMRSTSPNQNNIADLNTQQRKQQGMQSPQQQQSQQSQLLTTDRSKKSSQWWQDVDYVEQPNGESIQVVHVNEETKGRLYRWLVDITLIKDEFNAKNVDRLAKFGKNGALFADLLNRITGKTNSLFNGIFRGAKNPSQVNVNFNKAFQFLRQQQKLNPRYLWCVDNLKDGNPNIFWGLIDDIWHWSHQKVSPFDARFKQNHHRLNIEQSRQERSNLQRENKEYSYDKICFNQEAQKQKKLEDNFSLHKANKLTQSFQQLQTSMQPSNYQSILSSSKQNIGNNLSAMNHSISMRQYSNVNNQQPTPIQQINQSISQNSKRAGSPLSNNFNIDNNLRDQSQLTFPTTHQQQSFNQTQKSRSPLRAARVQMPTNSYKDQSDYRKLIVETTNSLQRSQSPSGQQLNQMLSPKHISNQTTARFKTDQAGQSNHKSQGSFVNQQYINEYQQINQGEQVCQSIDFQSPEERFYNLQSDFLNKSINQNQMSIVKMNSPSHQSTTNIKKNISTMNSPGISRITSQKSFFGQSKNYVETLRTTETRNIFSPTRQGQTIVAGGGNIIDKNIEKICKNWLLEIDYKERELTFFTKDDTKFMYQDEVRNGLFLQSLLYKIGMWNPSFERKGLFKKPSNIEECRYNLSLVFEILQENKVQIPEKYWNYELLLQGSINAFWNVIYGIKKHLYGTDTDSYEQNAFKILPYSESEIIQLENSLTQWLSNEILQTKIDNLFIQYNESLKNGLFWVQLVETITKRKVKNANYNPKEQLHYYNNIRNALAPLKTYRNFGQGFTYKEEKLIFLNKQVILGLLEDFRRYSDGQPARQEPNYFKDGPYFGFRKMVQNNSNYKLQVLEDELDSHRLNTATSPQNHTSSRNNISQFNPEQSKSIQNATSPQSNRQLNQSKSSKMLASKELGTDNTLRLNSNRSNFNQTPRHYRQGSFGDQIIAQSDLQSSFRRRPSNLSNYGIDTMKQQLNQSGSQQTNREKSPILQNVSPSSKQKISDQEDNQQPTSNNKMSQLFKKFVSPIKLNQSNRMNYDASFDTSQKMSNYIPEQRQDQRSPNESQNRSGEFSYLRDLQSPKKTTLNQTYLSSSIYQSSGIININLRQILTNILTNFKEGEIFNWLCLLGFEDFVNNVDFEQTNIEEMKDGIFIANLVQVLEGKEIKGLIMEPKKMSCCIQNIRKAFNLIRDKRDVDFALVQFETKFYEAERNYIFSLLNNLKYAYRQKTKYYLNFNKSQSRSLLNHNLTMSQPKRAEELYYSKKEKENYILNKNEWEKSIVRPIKAQI